MPSIRPTVLLSAALLALSLLAAAAGPGGGRATDAPPRLEQDSVIRRIRAAYARTNAGLPRCERRRRELMDQSTEGGRLDAYVCRGEVVKLVAVLYGETGRATEEFYLAGGRPYFVYRVSLRYERPFGKVASTGEDRFYFQAGRLVRWLRGRRTVPPASPEAREEEREVLARAAELLARAGGESSR
ncbi:MAG TPA: hypothetical protein VF746_05090 [Longimicrobium sp.]|jgi:hypothetical protein